MKVLVLPAWYPSPEQPSKVSFLREHVRAISLFHDVLVLSAQRDPSVIPRQFVLDHSVEDDARIVRMKYRRSLIPKTTLLLYAWSVVRAFRAIVRAGFRPDVIHAHFYGAALPAVLLGKLSQIPVVVTEHSASYATGFEGLSLLEAKISMGMADMLIAVSRSLQVQMERVGIRGNFRIIPNPVDTEVFSPASGAKDLRRGVKRILVVARLHPVKGFPVLFEALVLLKQTRGDFILDIVGDGELRLELELAARDLGLGQHVAFYGFQPRRTVADFMRRSHVFVLPSLTENCPCAVLEALASGVPVVVSDVGDLREIVPEGMGKLFPAGDARALAEVLSQTLERLPYYEPSVIAAYASTRFSLRAVGEQIDRAYRDAALWRMDAFPRMS